MQYIKLTEDNKILAVADWEFPDSIPAKEEVVKNEEGQLVYKSELDKAHEDAIRLERAKAAIRGKRNQLIAETDYLVLPDAQVTDEERTAIMEYRQALRDITKQAGFPNNIEWPVKP